MRVNIKLVAVSAAIISLFGIVKSTNAFDPITGFKAEGPTLTVGVSDFDAIKDNTKEDYVNFLDDIGFFDTFKQYVNLESVEVENVEAEKAIKVTVKPGFLKPEVFEKIDSNKDGIYRKLIYSLMGDEIRFQIEATRLADGTFDYKNQIVTLLTTRDEFKAEKAREEKRKEVNEFFEKAKTTKELTDLEAAEQALGKLGETTRHEAYWKSLVNELKPVKNDDKKEEGEESKDSDNSKKEEGAQEIASEEVKNTTSITAPNTGVKKNSNVFEVFAALIAGLATIAGTIVVRK